MKKSAVAGDATGSWDPKDVKFSETVSGDSTKVWDKKNVKTAYMTTKTGSDMAGAWPAGMRWPQIWRTPLTLLRAHWNPKLHNRLGKNVGRKNGRAHEY